MRTAKRERALKLNVIRAQLLKLGIPQMLHRISLRLLQVFSLVYEIKSISQ